MPRFNPFRKVDGKYGAPMGRHGDDAATYDGESNLYARHCGGDGYYDRGGAYWGHSRVFAVWTRGGAWCAYVEARSTLEALAIVTGKDRRVLELEAAGFSVPADWVGDKLKAEYDAWARRGCPRRLFVR